MTWLLPDPTLHLEGPTERSERMERKGVEAAEKREDEEDLAHYATRGRFRKGRQLVQKMGWQDGTAQGRGGGECDSEQQLLLWAARSYDAGRSEHAGIRVPKMTSHTCAYQPLLDRFPEQCRMTQGAPLGWRRSQAFPAEKSTTTRRGS
eukprot:1736421-Pyramimonas_sp.AAC.1